jgi:quinol monooxygenase YgiN
LFTFRLRVVLPPPAYAQACRTLRSLRGPVRAQPGCCATRLLRELDDEGSLTFVEEWRERADLEEHLRSAAFHRIVAVMELASEAPEVEIDEVASRSGLDLVESILAIGRTTADGLPS